MLTPRIRTAPLVLALAACATPFRRFDPLPDTQRLPVEYRADAVAGVASDARWLGVATATQLVPIPGIGDWWLGPADFVLVSVAPFPAAPRLPSVTTQIAVPMSAAGSDVYFQEVRLGVLAADLRLSNYVHLNL